MRISERRKYAHDLFLLPSFSISMSMPPSFLPSLPPPSPPDPPQSLGRGRGRGGSLLPMQSALRPTSSCVGILCMRRRRERARGRRGWIRNWGRGREVRHVLEFLFDRHTHFKLAGGDALFMRRLAGIKCFLTQVLSREEGGGGGGGGYCGGGRFGGEGAGGGGERCIFSLLSTSGKRVSERVPLPSPSFLQPSTPHPTTLHFLRKTCCGELLLQEKRKENIFFLTVSPCSRGNRTPISLQK